MYLNVALGLLVCMSNHLFYEELTAGILAARAEKVWVMSIQPRTSCRPGDVAVSVFAGGGG